MCCMLIILECNHSLKRTRGQNQSEEISPIFLEILEANIYHILLSLGDFLAWHATCRQLSHYLVEGILGRYTQAFCKEATRKNQFLLERRKNSLYFQNLKQLHYLSQLSNTIDSIMGPIVFDVNTLKRVVIPSCTLEAIGYSEKSSLSEKTKLYQILVKSREYIRNSYGWDLLIIRGSTVFLLPLPEHLNYLKHRLLWIRLSRCVRNYAKEIRSRSHHLCFILTPNLHIRELVQGLSIHHHFS